ncbi:MAG: methyltransferase domain-containing protein [Rhodospirillales bacterium]|nr:methyltransferase domain-containing protein [Rhodospirillales bacterium]
MDWSPGQYLKFAPERARPALDLLDGVKRALSQGAAPRAIFDLGCGTGMTTRLLAERWPAARVTGIDSSAPMLAQARAGDAAIEWREADLAAWSPPDDADLLFSNAALQWLDNHAQLFPHLIGPLRPGALLAVQMPRNYDQPSHENMVVAARSGPWRARLEPILRARPVAAPEDYFDILAPHVRELEVWETTYLHALEGEDAVLEWTAGTGLRPYLQALEGEDKNGFLAVYGELTRAAYPRRGDGRTLFPFRRLFLVARR